MGLAGHPLGCDLSLGGHDFPRHLDRPAHRRAEACYENCEVGRLAFTCDQRANVGQPRHDLLRRVAAAGQPGIDHVLAALLGLGIGSDFPAGSGQGIATICTPITMAMKELRRAGPVVCALAALFIRET